MDRVTLALVRDSWRRVEAIAPAAAALFYDNLFHAQPALRPLFKGDLTVQGARLMKMIGAAVDQLDDPGLLAPVLQALGRRHRGYGVRDEHYQAVGEALLLTLAQGLVEHFTPAVRDAWARVYDHLAQTMIAGARDPLATSP